MLTTLVGNHLTLHLLKECGRGFRRAFEDFSILVKAGAVFFTAAKNLLLLGVLESWR